jgi:hypothetical protein
VSSPQLMVLDNQTARIQVGDQVPITVQSSQSVIDADAFISMDSIGASSIRANGPKRRLAKPTTAANVKTTMS